MPSGSFDAIRCRQVRWTLTDHLKILLLSLFNQYISMRLLYTFIFISFSWLLQASPGDTTIVKAHQKVDMTWYRSYRAWAQFPDANHSYHKILLRYDMGCASGGCSDWDYTTLVNILHPTGLLDSNVQRIDTISTNPLVVDTVWNVFPEKERYELGKVITPFGGNLANSWSRRFYFDVTDYYSMLRDSVELEVFFQGWSSGFSASLEFVLIEGTPPREVLQLQNLYRGRFTYRDAQTFESNSMPERSVQIHDSTQHTSLRMAPSGHGFVNSLNCAEFCKKDYIVNVNGTEITRQLMWRDDCGANGLFPQAGTWLFDRANWCPGDRVIIYNHDLSAHLPKGNNRIDVDVEPYSYTVPSGETPATYNMSAQLIQYGKYNHQYDLELTDILKPSAEDEYARLNPVCGEALIRVTNKGAQDINQFKVVYGIRGSSSWQEYTHNGLLASMQSLEISLPLDSIAFWTTYRPEVQFRARVELPSGKNDEVPFNNSLDANVVLPAQYPANLALQLRTNGKGNETFWELRDSEGKVLHSGDNLASSTFYRDTFNLKPGCYEFFVGDRDEDGLMFFANNDGRGSVALQNAGGNFFFKQYNANFGSFISDHFTVGYGIGIEESLHYPPLAVDVYPNPVVDQVAIENFTGKTMEASLFTVTGKRVMRLEIRDGYNTYRLHHLAPGMYQLVMELEGRTEHRKLVIRR